ncbi:hypothetical protein LGL55_10460 [Clostridium tagluense]|uniref:hypothetical protein n=1 Tax=Clostridium tagluense TaxID=360422 RepID=UPI001CF1ECCA|nr:hypothetical protein [Clostridium tagluense]MCB2300630.1 hypothetical protein [Clostridium tagluense]MCB2311639.1 hypothetical protein [Clostridium tagluense]MCB2316363.1 hypothetical protein [Clostridium tagluense]MCB2321253.1 hypothetical protein [Clostridium tagluense]MCB2326232.1 hypothetical protein [Clostridium tagluense]
MKLDYINRSCKTNRQAILDKALIEELEYLRKKCFPHQKKSFLWEDIQIKEKVFDKEDKTDTLGLYVWDEGNLKHIIYITKIYIWGSQKLHQSWQRKIYYNKVKKVIRHELCHAFVKEQWEYKCKRFITDKNVDASPIFLAVLQFVDGYTGHDCYKGYKKTELYKRIQNNEFKTYKKLHDYLADYLWDFTEAIEQIKKISNQDRFIKQEDKNYFTISNEFKFAPRANGLDKFMEVNYIDVFRKDNEIRSQIMINRTWTIGCNIEPKNLIKLYNKKQDCQAQYYNNIKNLIIMPVCANVEDMKAKDIRTISIKNDKNF